MGEIRKIEMANAYKDLLYTVRKERLETVWQYLLKLNNWTLYDSVIPPVGLEPEKYIYVYGNTRPRIFLAAHF